ncbi:MAG: pantoate--beta-alanine ligase [Gammaproteobacteria bacterium]|nr:pantoate--beta-alanine ligase [Gammaproteobacteria bacterium]
MKIVTDLPGLRAQIRTWHAAGERIAFVPTLGNLHDGHISLIAKARELADHTVASIFVNPIQFGSGEDYERYPSTLDADCARLRAIGLDLLFTPDLKQLYPGGIEADTRVTVPRLSNILCGEMRPGHFSGVATVVSKLFFNVQPDVALFGEKDYQQLLVIRRMVHDLCIPVTIVGMPTVREADGLAMSSRNGYLTAAERAKAPLIHQTLRTAAARLRAGAAPATIEHDASQTLAAAGFRPEYVSVRRLDDLEPPAPGERRFSILVAAWLGGARLIDNIKVDLDVPADDAPLSR